MLPMFRVEDADAATKYPLAVQLLKTDGGTVVAQLVGRPEHIPDNWLSTDVEIQHDVAYVLQKADRYSRLEGQPAILIYDVDHLWQDDWGELQ